MAREILEKTKLDYDESIISYDVKSLYSNVPLMEAVKIARGEYMSKSILWKYLAKLGKN